ncbi:hypothetical protein [Butyrivibrio fibrisolvens]|uniref:hypothetical protein n=1 Tax=Butyrivibrio fibrisolvens TaxID=831 RepID=UPI0003B6073E|nr:hypothetical protein [Butyrivibrio fibrisolvens]
MKKAIIEICSFAIVFAVMISTAFRFLSFKDTGGGGGFQNYYSTESGLIDVLFLGSSHAHCTVNNAKLWEDAGISSFTLSSGNQSIDTSYVFLNEALKTQHPKIVFVETYTFDTTNTDNDTINIYRSSLLPKWHPSSLMYGLSLQEDYDFDNTTLGELYLRFPITHSRYEDLKSTDFCNYYPYKRGYLGSTETGSVNLGITTDATTKLNAKTQKYMDMMISRCKEDNIRLIFFCAPYNITEDAYAYQNSIGEYAVANGAEFYNMNSPEYISLFDGNTDFRYDEHLNNSGADKVTQILEDIILGSGIVEDHRGDEAYSEWDDDLTFMKDRMLCFDLYTDELELPEYLTYLTSYDSSRFKIIVALAGDYKVLGTDSYNMFESIGIDANEYSTGGVFLDGTPYTVYDDHSCIDLGENECSIVYDKESSSCRLYYGIEEYAECQNGAVMLIYDTEISAPVDAVYLDYYNFGLQILRADNIEVVGK